MRVLDPHIVHVWRPPPVRLAEWREARNLLVSEVPLWERKEVRVQISGHFGSWGSENNRGGSPANAMEF